jgi:hypothetical protein
MTPLPGHPIDNAIPDYPFDNWRKIDIPSVKVGKIFHSRDAIRDHCERVFDAEASIAFWMMNVYKFGNQFYSKEEMGMFPGQERSVMLISPSLVLDFPFLGMHLEACPLSTITSGIIRTLFICTLTTQGT